MSTGYETKPCKMCGSVKEYGYRKGAYCSICTEKIRKSKRVYNKKLPHGSGRKPTCSTCGKLKEKGRENESRCKECKANAYKENRMHKRAESGLRPYGSGRKDECSKCGKIKENRKKGYCNSCNRERDNEWRLETGRTKKHRTGKCRCGNDFAPYSKYLCSKCRMDEQKKYYLKNPEKKKLHQNQSHKNRISTPEGLFKLLARDFTNSAKRLGFLKKMPCEICGEEKVDAHHDDYMKPLDVRWLCRKHHVEYHNNKKQELKQLNRKEI
jgi:hypothetical protein